jgi:hypothetical protein
MLVYVTLSRSVKVCVLDISCSSLTLYRELNFSWGKKLYIECCSRKERSGTAWLIVGIWQLKGVRRNADKERCPLCLEEEDEKHILLECKETKHRREK